MNNKSLITLLELLSQLSEEERNDLLNMSLEEIEIKMDKILLNEMKEKQDIEILNTNYKNNIFKIGKYINDTYPNFLEDYSNNTLDTLRIIHAIETYSDFRIAQESDQILVNSKGDYISYSSMERKIYNMVYHQICNLNL